MSHRSDDDWRKALTPEQYQVCRVGGTEAPFSGELLNHKKDGEYLCVCCSQPLFDSETKFDSGSGWPSFFKEKPAAIVHKMDNSHGMARIELQCQSCAAHLGHLFSDGPLPTGLRFCINSVALKFKAKEP